MTPSNHHEENSRFSLPESPWTKASVKFGGGRRRLGAVLLAILLCHAAAWGKPITPQQAEKTAKAWLATDGQPLGVQIGHESGGKTESFAGSDGQPLYYVVYLKPSGFVILPADDLAEPIVCFAASGQYDPSDIDPLAALVTRDLTGRVQRARETETAALKGKALPPAAANARSKWGRLLESGDVVKLGLPSLSDLRVAPLLQSKWSQDTECGNNCYNYYTPTNYPSGCVATAQAQLMRLYQHPTAAVGTPCFGIEVCGVPQTRCLRGGNGSGGAYAWTNMVLDPDCNTTDAQRQAIGALCHDVGVSLSTDYCSGSSSAVALETATSLKNTFGYGNAVKGYKNLANIGSGLNGMVNPNLDAGYPVLLGLDGSYGGHAVVADGYGYQSSTLYHHLNLGWAGTDNAWYNLPNVDASYPFDTVDTCVYNVYVTGSGEIISGRVVDSFGLPISGASVTAIRTGGGTYTGTTGSTGVYGLPKVPSASSYTVSVTAPGYTFTAQAASTGTSSDYAAVSGNAWGVNFQAAGCCAASGGCTKYISGVQVGSISNTGTGCSGYGDYTYLSTTMEIGSSHPITVTSGNNPSPSDQCGIWVDWNRDNDFSDSGETIAVSGTPGNGPYTATITPPAGASLGNTRLRVRITYTGTVAPCGTTTYGEVEDYLIVVSPTTYSISGRVTSSGIGVAGVTMIPSPSGEPATTDSSGNYTISGLLAGTYTVTPGKAGCTFTPPSIGSITVGPSQTGKNFTASCVPYCSASGGCDEHITGVQVGSINNTGTGCDGYRDYTGLLTTMAIGSGYPITVTNIEIPYDLDRCGIWVDWNRDGDFFDSNETISINVADAPWVFTATITPPGGAGLGLTRMRVRITYGGTPAPCGTTQYGEVEDYSINVTGCTIPGAPTGLSASDETYCDKVRVTWSAVSGAQSYNVYRSTTNTPCAEPPLATAVTGTSYDDASPDLGTTQYYYSVKAVNACGAGACSLTDPGRRGGAPVDFNHDCDVDADDYDWFDACASGPGVGTAAGCEAADLDLDNDVDQTDFSTFQRCVSGQDVPADPDCAG